MRAGRKQPSSGVWDWSTGRHVDREGHSVKSQTKVRSQGVETECRGHPGYSVKNRAKVCVAAGLGAQSTG